MAGVFEQRFIVGDRVRFTIDWANAQGAPVTVIGVGTGRRVTVSYGDVASIVVPEHFLMRDDRVMP